MKRISFLLVFCFSFWLNQAVAASSDQFEFGSISGPCVDSSCVIKFKNNYTDPLVFLMASYANGHWNDAPSTLRVISVKKGQGGNARIRQYFAPYNHTALKLVNPNQCHGEDWCLTKQPMENISYFVIENGADINLGSKGRIIARSVTTNKYIRYKQSVSSSDSDYISTNNLIGANNLDGYGVIAESQEVKYIDKQLPPNGVFESQIINKHYFDIFDDYYNYTSYWYTPLVVKEQNGFYLSLDRGETVINNKYDDDYNSYHQKVGYLLVKGSGQYKGLLFSLGNGETPNTLGNNKNYKGFGNVTVPPQRQCDDLVSVPNSNKFNNLPFVLASKNSRNGSDGGIFRLCKLESTDSKSGLNKISVSFVTDEDLNEPRRGAQNEACGGQACIERRHANESYGFMAFQQAVDSETCELFPGPAQSWDTIDSDLEGSHNISIIGSPIINGQYHLGFSEIKNTSGGINKFCNGNECINAKNYPKLYAKKVILDTWPGKDDGSLEEQSDINNNKKEFWFDAINLTNENIIFPVGSIVHTKVINMHSSSITTSSNNPDDLIIYVHKLKPRARNVFESFDMNHGSSITALIYSERNVYMAYGGNADTRITGALTAPEINMVGSKGNRKSEIIGQSSCFESTPKYTLTLSSDMISTLCNSKKITFSVNSTNGDNYSGEASFILTSASSGEWSTTENFTANTTHKFNSSSHTYQLNINNNQATIWLRSDDVATININASIENNTVTATGQYHFSMADDVYFSMTNKQENIIAGKTFNTTITAKICGVGNKAKTLTQYTGDKHLKLDTKYIQPITPAYDTSEDGKTTTPIQVEVITGSVGGAKKQLDIKFTKGVSSKLSLKYREAGVIQWQVTDSDFSLNTTIIPTSSSAKITSTKIVKINGVLDINSRPWTFAICPLTFNGKNEYRLANGTSKGGEAYTAAGHPFDVLLKPLVWRDSDVSNQKYIKGVPDVSNQNYCNDSVTKNFLVAGSPPLGSGVISQYSLDTPNNGNKGIFHLGTVTKAPTLNGLLVKGNTWNEVGSVWLQVGLNNYLGMNIDQSKRHIGRFYPAYFKLEDNSVTPAIGGFTYMDQPFSAKFNVFSYNQQGHKLKNYHLFADDLKSKMQLVVMANGKDLTDRYQPKLSDVNKWGASKSGYSMFSYQPNTVKFLRHYTDGLLTTSKEDGPYPDWTLRVKQTSTPDGVTWQDKDKGESELVGMNDLRYGRMVLKDAAGDIGKSLTIPLRVEYWNGSEFVINTDDSTSKFDGANYCRQILIQEPAPHTPNNPTTSGTGTVIAGLPFIKQLVANPDGSFKQQIRFWQRLSASTKPKQIKNTPLIICNSYTSNQPWLSYNWRDLGDEDPSATVTFGVYHGNNRIIYRGETNNVGQPIPYQYYQ